MLEPAFELRSYIGDVRTHEHEYHQIVLPFHGQLELEAGRSGGRVTAGVGAFIAAGQHHSFRAKSQNAFVVMDVPVEMMSTHRYEAGGLAFFPITAAVQGLLDYVTAISANGDLPEPLRPAWSTLMLDRLLPVQTKPDLTDIALHRAVTFMKERLAHPIRVADVAVVAGLSPTRLHLAFRNRLHSTPHAYLATLRLDAAERMLAATDYSIAEIAIRTGHADQSALTRALRQKRGSTPAALKRALRAAIPVNEA